ncbi:lamin tail domain-containing protein [Candidatus Daviesbacteria bacterium]|nr:lamin tail domain-containing protein [Candidatus Daviesbacteria bacterium]
MRIKLLVLAYLILFIGVRSVFANSVILNELMPHPSPGSDWIEIYNPTESDIDLSNWILVDSTSTMKTLSGSITVNGFIVFDVTNRLNNSGDSIFLKDANGTTIDNYSYNTDPGINISFGRSPDGGGWNILVNSSKGSNNGESAPTPAPSPTPSPSPTPNPSPSPLSTLTPSPSPANSPSASKSKTSIATPKSPTPSLNPTTPSPSAKTITLSKLPSKSLVKTEYKIASVAAVNVSATPEAKVGVKSQKQTNYFIWTGIILIFAGISSIGYAYFRKNAQTHISIRKRD